MPSGCAGLQMPVRLGDVPRRARLHLVRLTRHLVRTASRPLAPRPDAPERPFARHQPTYPAASSSRRPLSWRSGDAQPCAARRSMTPCHSSRASLCGRGRPASSTRSIMLVAVCSATLQATARIWSASAPHHLGVAVRVLTEGAGDGGVGNGFETNVHTPIVAGAESTAPGLPGSQPEVCTSDRSVCAVVSVPRHSVNTSLLLAARDPRPRCVAQRGTSLPGPPLRCGS